jgi:glycyl-tRNA synthetase alpha subunit
MLPVRLVQAYQRLAVVRPSRDLLTEVFLSSLDHSNAPERLGHEDIQVREHPDRLVLYYQSVQR